MSYDICFKAKLKDVDRWVNVMECEANITWNVREMIVAATGLEWHNEEDNGLCRDVMKNIYSAADKLQKDPAKYKKYESPNGYGTVNGCLNFFLTIIRDWERMLREDEEVANVSHFFYLLNKRG